MSAEFYGFDDPDFDEEATPDEQFEEWVRELDEDVIQGEFGYERGEFTVYPSLWRALYDKGMTPRQAWQRALDAHREAREEEERERLVTLTPIQTAVLRQVVERGADLRKCSEAYRQSVIDLAMMEPPLVDVDADRVFATTAGAARIRARLSPATNPPKEGL